LRHGRWASLSGELGWQPQGEKLRRRAAMGWPLALCHLHASLPGIESRCAFGGVKLESHAPSFLCHARCTCRNKKPGWEGKWDRAFRTKSRSLGKSSKSLGSCPECRDLAPFDSSGSCNPQLCLVGQEGFTKHLLRELARGLASVVNFSNFYHFNIQQQHPAAHQVGFRRLLWAASRVFRTNNSTTEPHARVTSG